MIAVTTGTSETTAFGLFYSGCFSCKCHHNISFHLFHTSTTFYFNCESILCTFCKYWIWTQVAFVFEFSSSFKRFRCDSVFSFLLDRWFELTPSNVKTGRCFKYLVKHLYDDRAERSFFMLVGLSKNIGHHGWLTTKKIKTTLAKMP